MRPFKGRIIGIIISYVVMFYYVKHTTYGLYLYLIAIAISISYVDRFR